MSACTDSAEKPPVCRQKTAQPREMIPNILPTRQRATCARLKAFYERMSKRLKIR